MPRWLIPWLVPAVLVLAVAAGVIGGIWGILAVFVAMLALFARSRLRHINASGKRDDAGYWRLSDLLPPRR
jgi:hypothetical protein